MTPIISPWVFYAIGITDEVSTIVEVLTFVSGLLLFGYLTYCLLDLQKPSETLVKKLAVPFVLSALLMTLIPSSATITKMLIAQNVTYERVEAATDTVEIVYNDIMELFEDVED